MGSCADAENTRRNVMRLHDLKATEGSRKRKIRVGRGIAGRRGKTAGRGTKGQNSRRGGGTPLYFEGGQLPLVRRLPFRRGFTNPFKIHFQEVNIWLLDRTFEDGATINPVILEQAGLIRNSASPIKILGAGETTKKFSVVANGFTKSAEKKITEAGGNVQAIPVRIKGIHAVIRKLPKAQEEARFPKMQ